MEAVKRASLHPRDDMIIWFLLGVSVCFYFNWSFFPVSLFCFGIYNDLSSVLNGWFLYQRVPNLIGGKFIESQATEVIDVINPVFPLSCSFHCSNVMFPLLFLCWRQLRLYTCQQHLFCCLKYFFGTPPGFRRHKRLFLRFPWLPRRNSKLQFLRQNRLFPHGGIHLLLPASV